MCSMTVACVLIPRFRLLAAVGERRELLGKAIALSPEPGREQAIGESSGAAEAFGVRAGMRLAEALARCPDLTLVPPDPASAETAWEEAVRRLEGIGAAVEPGRPGEAFFEADGLRGLCGGHLEGVLGRTRRAIGMPARLGAGPTRFCAYVAARRARARGVVIVPAGAARAFLAPLPVALLRERLGEHRAAREIPGTLERLGVRTLGDLASLPRAAVADRFGGLGLRAQAMAGGEEELLRPRRAHEELTEGIELPESASGQQLERALSLLVDRLLAHPQRRGRTIRRLRLAAPIAAGGSWRAEVALRRASAAPERLRLAVRPKLAELPGPASRLELRALVLGPPVGDQESLARSAREDRRARLAEAVRQARAAAGRDAVLQVLEMDPGSRIPERRMALTPFPEPSEGKVELKGSE
jgi:protein ImuB